MKSLSKAIGLFLLAVSWTSACKKDDAPSGVGASTGAPAAAAAVPATTTATAAATANGTSTETTEDVCPFPRRCSDACKKAHFKAMDACIAEWKVVEKAVPNVNEMGACTARCIPSTNAAGCVGAATKEECACRDKCTAGFPAAVKALGEPYKRCYAKTVAAACF